MSKGRYILITPHGENEPINYGKMKLETAQELVGGYVEVVPLFNKYLGQPCIVLCDEEGKLKGKPVNNRASLEWYKCLGHSVDDMLVGDILVLQGDAMRGWQ